MDRGPQEICHRVRGDRGSASEGQQREAPLAEALEQGEAPCAGPREPPGLDGTALPPPECGATVLFAVAAAPSHSLGAAVVAQYEQC